MHLDPLFLQCICFRCCEVSSIVHRGSTRLTFPETRWQRTAAWIVSLYLEGSIVCRYSYLVVKRHKSYDLFKTSIDKEIYRNMTNFPLLVLLWILDNYG
jgi:hypothetical protein